MKSQRVVRLKNDLISLWRELIKRFQVVSMKTRCYHECINERCSAAHLTQLKAWQFDWQIYDGSDVDMKIELMCFGNLFC